VEDLLSHLDSPHTDYEARALTVKALKNLQCSLAYGEHVANILRQSSVWKQFEQQKHDLFITNQGSMGGYLTAATPGVAGYLTTTSGQAKSTPSLPPPMEENKSNPILNNPLL
jgi:DnaJ family protein C protein 13